MSTTTFATRVWGYMREMYPLEVYVPFSFIGFFGCDFLLQALDGATRLVVTPRALVGALTLTAFSLLMRLFDELKDAESDKTLFPHRALPSGRVHLGDLQGLAWALGGAMLLANAALGPVALGGFLLLLAYGLGTFKYFFVPHWHQDNLLLTVATHNPVVVFCNLYVYAVFLADAGRAPAWPPAAAWAGVVMFWLPVLAWEFSRKIKAPQEENAYITYSRLLGPRGAALVPVAAISAAAGLALWLSLKLGLPGAALGVGAIATFVALAGFVRWLWRPTPEHSRLKPFAEAFSMGLYLAVLGGLVARYGVAWGGGP